MKLRYTSEQWDTAVASYLAGASSADVAVSLGVTPHAFIMMAHRRGVPIRESSDATSAWWQRKARVTRPPKSPKLYANYPEWHGNAVRAWKAKALAAGLCERCGRLRGRSRRFCDRCLKKANASAVVRRYAKEGIVLTHRQVMVMSRAVALKLRRRLLESAPVPPVPQ